MTTERQEAITKVPRASLINVSAIFIGAALLGLFALAAITTVAGLYISKFGPTLSENQEVWGLFGDFVGGSLNPLLAFLTLVAIVATLMLQSVELRQTQLIMREQGDSIRLQAFERTFFELLRLQSDLTKELTLDDEGPAEIQGRPLFIKILAGLETAYLQTTHASSSDDEIENIRNAYKRFMGPFENSIGHYLRNLRRILHFIDRKCPDDSTDYFLILRAQLSSRELALLAYQIAANPSFFSKRRLDQCEFFAPVRRDLLLEPDSHFDLLIAPSVSNVP